eukprot:CAMPEP_0113533190 /NCGR_PEP_ID=MMETSP0015_2-20120614/4464_1 /TAXON_ID=2838 /ORGANISM="Odontella" /LENGTH=198 /DNA_ID=CAMNT_0000432209 /DNA_START=124 /DNA_END=717 /DNA_ORIENTATION=- /assembly_acc=CAM_ASM_000160
MIFQKPFAVGTFVYQALYFAGLAPWERMKTSPMAEQIADIIDIAQEGIDGPPYGRALDLGCGRGLWSIELAQRGWDTVGIDVVQSALEAARDNANEAGVEPTFLLGDMTDLQDSGVGSGFGLILDFGGVHGLDPSQFSEVGKEVTSVADSGAHLIVVAAQVGTQAWPQPRGMSMEEIESTYPDWDMIRSIQQGTEEAK